MHLEWTVYKGFGNLLTFHKTLIKPLAHEWTDLQSLHCEQGLHLYENTALMYRYNDTWKFNCLTLLRVGMSEPLFSIKEKHYGNWNQVN